jgi:preprotein translocase SecE subunit
VENQRAVAVLFICGGLLAGLFARSAVAAVQVSAALEDPVIGFARASTLIGVAVGVVTLGVLLRNQVAGSFVDSVVVELKQVTWPTREETTSNTSIVVGATLFFSVLLSSYDFLWAKLTGIFLYTTG